MRKKIKKELKSIGKTIRKHLSKKTGAEETNPNAELSKKQKAFEEMLKKQGGVDVTKEKIGKTSILPVFSSPVKTPDGHPDDMTYDEELDDRTGAVIRNLQRRGG